MAATYHLLSTVLTLCSLLLPFPSCGNKGHIARDCPEPENPDAKKPKGRRRGPKCYNCGEIGHISKDCPDAGQGPKCYNCGNFGHISSACPEPSNRD